MKLLTVGLVLVTAAVAGCSSTTAGPAGAMQDAAGTTAPSTTASSFSPVASPTDSPSASESPQSAALLGATGEPNNDVCDADLQYACGDIGASGVGTVFYANSTAFPCGADMTSVCNYLEAAPNLWAPDSESTCSKTGSPCGGSSNDQYTSDFSNTGKGITWYTGGRSGNQMISGAGATAIGSGLSNTLAIVQVCNTGDAASAAHRYQGGGKIDWALPSKQELAALLFYGDRAAIGGFTSGEYWTSSQYSQKQAWLVNFKPNAALWGRDSTSAPYGVRPIRAF